MRSLIQIPPVPRLCGWLLALAHTIYVGMVVYWEHRNYYSGLSPDLAFHGFGFPAIDFPILVAVLLIMRQVSGGLAENIFTFAVRDLLVLVLGAAYCLVVGICLARLTEPHIRRFCKSYWQSRSLITTSRDSLILALGAYLLWRTGLLDWFYFWIQPIVAIVFSIGLPIFLVSFAFNARVR